MGKTLEKVEYEVGKAGLVFNPEDGYSLSTPSGVASAVAAGKTKIASFSPYLGEQLVILADRKPRKKGIFK